MSNELHAKPPEASFEPLPPEEPFDLVWVDIETTGLHPSAHDILEIAVAVSKSTKPFEIEHIFHEVLPFPDVHVHLLDPFILETHGKSGLIRESLDVRKGLASENQRKDCLKRVLSDMAACVRRNTRGEVMDVGRVLAGSTVHFDRKFLEYKGGEEQTKLFIHRHYDVSSIKLFCQSLGMPKIPKGEAHRARADIEESVAHARQCAEWLNRAVIRATGASSMNQFRPSKENT